MPALWRSTLNNVIVLCVVIGNPHVGLDAAELGPHGPFDSLDEQDSVLMSLKRRDRASAAQDGVFHVFVNHNARTQRGAVAAGVPPEIIG